jgi:pimeloyl-ACP methyl ester carboxylesterase
LADLLTRHEDETYSNRFDIKLLSQRLIDITNWVLSEPELKSLPIGYFGASTGAASALTAAAIMKDKIKAIVSRGGRPDLALIDFSKIQAATLLIVGEKDYDVLILNQNVYKELNCAKELAVVTGATHLFEETGALEQVASLAADWFFDQLVHPVKKRPKKYEELNF